ncbi:MAG: hypothetical protein V3S14_02315 [Anaerolineae bacterium]
MNQNTSPRLWATFGVGIVAVVGVGLLLMFLSRGPGAPIPMATSAPDENPVVASVNDHLIRHSSWLKAALLDQVLSGLAGQPAPTSDETLQRLINEALVLEAFPPDPAPTTAQVEAQITELENAWGVNDDAVVTALENAGLIRADLERAIGRLLAVQAGLEALESAGHDTTTWLEEQRNNAEIVVNEAYKGAVIPYTPVAQAQSQSPLVTPSTSPIPTSVPPTAPSLLPSPSPAPALFEIAPDFTLERAGGGEFTLTEQLAQGPVGLIFFQKCG